MVPTAVLLLLQVPPVTELESGMHEPTHTAVPPLIAPGAGVMVNDLVTVQPLPVEYVSVAGPFETPHTRPLQVHAIEILELVVLQAPPVAASVKV